MGFTSCKISEQKLAEALGIDVETVKAALKEARYGGYAKIWSVEDMGNYSTANISVSKKNKETEKYDTEFQEGFVRLVGQAHEFMKGRAIPENGLSVMMTSTDETNKYDNAKKKMYYNHVIFGLEDASGDTPAPSATQSKKSAKSGGKKSASNSKSDFAMLDDDDAQLPF